MTTLYSRRSEQKDQAILNVLNEVIKRPLFLGLHHEFFKNPRAILQNLQVFGQGKYKTEVVGSSRDGLKCSRAFSCGDIDSLVYSPIILDESDEKTFEYRQDFPAYFHFPQPDKFSSLSKSDGKYLNPNHIRQLNSSLFPPSFKEHSFTIIPQLVQTSDVKCAITKTMPYKDSTYKPEFAPAMGSLDHKLCQTWSVDQTVLAYLVCLRNYDRLHFVRELLYGSETNMEDFNMIKTSMKQLLSHWKADFYVVYFGTFDLLHFDWNKSFQDSLKEAVDVEVFEKYRCIPTKVPHGEYSADAVPAIQCKSWPHPAHSFLHRKRQWPPQNVIDDIVKSGFQVVARGCPVRPEPTKDFILSFSPVEAKLVDHLPTEAKTAYCLLKSCYKCALSKEDTGNCKTLKSYHLKTSLFWVAENTEPDSWKTMNPLIAVRLLIEFLIDRLSKLHLPVFFVQDSNLIGDFTEEDKNASIRILTAIHKNPANFIQVLLDTEWEYTKITVVDDGSYERLRKDGGPLFELTWEEEIKMFAYSAAGTGDCPIDDIMDKPGFFLTKEFQDRFVGQPFNTSPPGNFADTFEISDDQLDNVDIFVQTVSQNEIDIFNVLDLDVEPEIVHHDENNVKQEMFDMYCMYDRGADRKFGEIFLSSSKIRLKFYANVFHGLCVHLLCACLQERDMYQNKDAVYIIRFLKRLIRQKTFNQENVEDLLHYLLFFCHFTRQRHHKLGLTDQMLRSIREFLQDAKNLMTVYFNPKLILPIPLDLGNKLVDVLKECFPRKNQTATFFGMDYANLCQPRRTVDDLPLD